MDSHYQWAIRKLIKTCTVWHDLDSEFVSCKCVGLLKQLIFLTDGGLGYHPTYQVTQEYFNICFFVASTQNTNNYTIDRFMFQRVSNSDRSNGIDSR